MTKKNLRLQTCSVLLFALLTTVKTFSLETATCRNLFQIEKHGINSRQIKTWLNWEQTESIPAFKLKVIESKISSQKIPFDSVTLTYANDASAAIKKLLSSDDGKTANWFSHPYNTSEVVPYFDGRKKTDGPTLIAQHNASRTVTIEIDGDLMGLKLPTDHPFGSDGATQESKASMQEDVLLARKRSEVVEKIDRELGQDDTLTILKYAAVVKDKKSGNGFVLRDLRPMQDGSYYLPAHQIPSIGKEIAKKNNVDFVEFWGKNWAERLGEVQAKTLIRYGIESEATNPQNYLIQLDNNFRPTGKIFYRDITDSNFNGSVARAIGLSEYVTFDEQNKIPVSSALVGWERNYSLTWLFEKNPSGFDTQNITPAWRQQHIQSYIKTIVKLLDLDSKTQWTYEKLSNFLSSDEGLKAVKRFHKIIGKTSAVNTTYFDVAA